MGSLIYGKPVSEAMSTPLLEQVNDLRSRGVDPFLAIVRIGESVDDIAYERGAIRKCCALGIEVASHVLPLDVGQDQFVRRLVALNQDKQVHGVLLLRPFPESIDEVALRKVLSPQKDVDGFSAENISKLYEGDASGFAPCTPSAVLEMLNHYEVPITGKHVVVLGRSMIVGMPVSMMLLRENATVTICHSKTENIAEVASQADILVSAMGRANFVTAEFIKPGAIVMDIGVSKDSEGNLCGDIHLESVLPKASQLTPVIGGVGVVTTSILARHVITACNALI